MRKIYFKYYTGFCGSNGAEVREYPDNITNEELDSNAWYGALENAAMYGYYPSTDLEELSDRDLEELEESGEINNYTDNIEGHWEEYDPEKHDGTY